MDPQAAQLLTALTGPQALHTLLFVALGLALAPAAQAVIEHNLAEKTWMPKGLKPWLPTIISSSLGYIATKFGIDPQAAMIAAASLNVGTHTVNMLPIAADAGSTASADAPTGNCERCGSVVKVLK